jgi:8-amino-7-oxononanoate synthase
VQWFDSILDEQLADLAEAGRLRQRRLVRQIDATHVQIDDLVLINFCSNDYLALTHHPRVLAALRGATEAGAGSAGLISGFTPHHAAAEAAIAKYKGVASAILLPSGYQANHAAIQTLAALRGGGGVRFLVDKLAHASLIDAIRASGMPWRTFGHNTMPRLARLLSEAKPEQLQVVVSESIFSMDGDAADLNGFAELKKKHQFVLLLDEAHATGVYGDGGAGLAVELHLQNIVDVSIVTLSKSIGCIGGAICGSEKFCQSVLNFGRAYMFSTSPPPAIADALVAAIAVMRDEPQRQQRVRELARRLRKQLVEGGLTLPAGDSPIIPLIVGEEKAALQLAGELGETGFLVQAIRPPTVCAGASRLRVTLCCEHREDDVDRLSVALIQSSIRRAGAAE